MNRNQRKRVEARVRAGAVNKKVSNKDPKWDFARTGDSPALVLQKKKRRERAIRKGVAA